MTTPKVTKRWLNAAQIVVKFTPVLRRFGTDCRNVLYSENRKVFSGEVGTVKEDTIHGNGWCETVLIAEFTHGRDIVFARKVLTERGNLEWEFTPHFDADAFKTIPKKPSTVV